MQQPISIYDRMKRFDKPFSYIVLNTKVNDFCSYCLRKPLKRGEKLSKCVSCQFVRYCNKNCQRLGWKDHRLECRRLNICYPNLPLTELLFLSRITDKVLFLKQNGDRFGWEKDRKWSYLMGHEEEIRADKDKYAHFEKIYNKMCAFREEIDMPTMEKFLVIFGKMSINTHSINTNAGVEIGMALDLGVSEYDHSCRPNCTLIFDGFRAILRPLLPTVDAAHSKTAFISYIDVGRSKYQRRQDLQSKWYFICHCDRCSDPNDDLLTSIRCSTDDCDQPLIITEDDKKNESILCNLCRKVTSSEQVNEARQLMLNLPGRLMFDTTTEQIEQMRKLLDIAGHLLHPDNIYYCRLQTVYLQVIGDLNKQLLDPKMQKRICENYRKCFPQTDRHIGYQLLHLVKSLIEQGHRDDAISYSFEAMTIFEVVFGLEHPYYLQTLALWTFLDTKADKTDEELISLMNFNYNRPVNIGKYLGAVSIGSVSD